MATRSGELLSRKARLSLKGTSLLILSSSSPSTWALRPGSTASARHREQVWLSREGGHREATASPSSTPHMPTRLSSGQEEMVP